MRRDLPSGNVTFLFTDIEGSTKLLLELGSERYAHELTEHRRIVRRACAARGGVEVDTQGDAFFVVFPDPVEALEAAIEMTDELRSGRIALRIGLHTGEPLLADGSYVGEDVHFAARVAATGHGGQIVLSEATRARLDGRFPLRDLGEQRLKDIPEPAPIYQVGEDWFPPLKTISNTNLPRPASSFVGREREVADLLRSIRSGARLLTLTGPGGSGKTRLALEAASSLVPEFKAGVFWVGLASVADASLVLEEIARTIGAKDDLATHIGERELLLLLDNLEQVIESAPALGSLVAACPNLTLLVTSRELLRVHGEVEYAVSPLASPDAESLFCERAGLAPTAAIAELCARLDHLPLAVELAAARTKALTPEQILDRIAQRLDLLKGGRDADPRQQTLRTTIAWSYDLLLPAEQRLFASLSVFSGGSTLEAAEQVCGADLDTLQALVEKSLVRFSDSRYWMLETIREYAAERLEVMPSLSALDEAHREWFLVLAEHAERESRKGNEGPLFDSLESDHDNLRAAAASFRRHEDVQRELRLATALWRFRAARGYVAEALRELNEALARSPAKPLLARLGCCYLGTMTGTAFAAEIAEAEAIAALAAKEGDRFVQVSALKLIGPCVFATGEFRRGEAALEEAISLSAGDFPSEEAEAMGWLLVAALYGERPAEEGIQRCRTAAARESDTVRAFALAERAALEAMQGSFGEARDLLSESRAIFRQLDLRVFGANTAQEGYFVEMLAGEPETAADDLRRAYDVLAEMGERGFLSTVAGYLANALLACGRESEADRYASICARVASDDDFLSQSLWRAVQAKLLARRGAHEQAVDLATQAVEVVEGTEQLNARADRRADLAEVLRLDGRFAEERVALREALMLYEAKGNVVAADRARAMLAELSA